MDLSRRLEPDHERTNRSLPRPGLRLRAVARWHRSVRFVPWLVPIGAVLMVCGLSFSILGGALGAVLVGIGVAASLWHPRVRRTTRSRSPRKAR
jgi:hypothetical protein